MFHQYRWRQLPASECCFRQLGFLPEIDWLGDSFRTKRHRDLLTESSRRVSRVENFLYHAAGFSIGDRRLLAADAAREVSHLLRESVIPVLLEYWIRPSLRRPGFLDSVSESDFRVGRKRVAHQHVGIGLALVAEHLDAVVHPAGAIPAALHHPD